MTGRKMRRVLGEAAACVLVAAATLTSSSVAGASTMPLKPWATRAGSDLTKMVKTFIHMTGTNVSVATCRNLAHEVSAIKRLPAPKGATSTWDSIIHGFGSWASACVATDGLGIPKKDKVGLRHAAHDFAHLVNKLRFAGLKVGKHLYRLVEGYKSPKSKSGPSSTTTTTAPTPNKPMGTAQTVSTELTNSSYTVKLVQVIDPAEPSTPTFTVPNTGTRFVAAEFTVTDTGSANVTDDANSTASIVGSDGQSYTATFTSVGECTDFNDGQFQLAPGQSVSGCVTFDIPNGVTASRVQWSASGGFGSTFVEWAG